MLAHTRGKQGKTVNRDWFLGDPDVGFIKDFKTAIIIMFEELKGNMITEWEENIVLISTWKISSERETMLREPKISRFSLDMLPCSQQEKGFHTN